MKRLFMWGLGLGGVLIAVLLVALIVISYRLKDNMQNSINAQLQVLQEYIPSISYEPFTCSGVKSIACESSSIGLDGVVLENVRLELGQFTQTQGSVRITSQKISFAGDETLTLLFGVLAQDVDFSTELLPQSLDCKISGVLGKSEQAQDFDTMDTSIACIIKGKNLSYKLVWDMQAGLGDVLAQAPTHFSDALSSILKAYQDDSQKILSHTPVLFKSATLSLEPKELAQAIITKLANGQKLDAQAYQQYRINLARSLQSMKAFVMYIALLGDHRGKAQYLEVLVDGVLRMILGENNGVVYGLGYKNKSANNAFPLGEWLQDPTVSLRKSGVTFSFEEIPLDSIESKKD